MIVIKRLLISGTKSGVGKTTITLGLLAALKKRGLNVAPFKVGPDFIDPGHHFRVTSKNSWNLDGWMLSKSYNLECFRKYSEDTDIAVVEGVMGLFDGYDGKSESGSSAQMAKWLELSVILVVDAGSMARSVAALISGFEEFDKGLSFAGVVFNNVGSSKHLQYLKDSLEGNTQMPCVGGIYHDREITIPKRYLGLTTLHDHRLSDKDIDMLANVVEKGIDIDKLLESLPDKKFGKPKPNEMPLSTEKIKPVVRIGIAWDNAFCFYYKDNLDILEAFGAELIYFSPIKDVRLPENIDGIYFGGGYPELFASQLSNNSNLRRTVRKRSLEGMPIYGECGGFMYLCRELYNTDGNIYPMTGCFPFNTRMLSHLRTLGYREIKLNKDTVVGKCGQTLRGHEFHYSELSDIDVNIENIYSVSGLFGQKNFPEGFLINRTIGTYIHLHLGSKPEAAKAFINSCLDYKNERMTKQ